VSEVYSCQSAVKPVTCAMAGRDTGRYRNLVAAGLRSEVRLRLS